MELEVVRPEQIFEKIKCRIAELQTRNPMGWEFCPELNPDVIVILDDQTMLFEPQNERALGWLHERCGPSVKGHNRRDSFRVHPSLSRRIIKELKAAGFEVAL